MEKIAKDTLRLWQEEGTHQIQQNFRVFRSLVAQTQELEQSHKYDEAVVYGQMAAFHASLKHCGLFVSPELEQILIKIGKEAIPKYSCQKSSLHSEKPKNILHVATGVQSIGGLSRMIWRWIQQDTECSHSLVLTRQPRKEVPRILTEAVTNSGGKIYKLNETIGSFIAWAKRLREIATTVDIVVLHIYNYDVIPIIAFANKEQCPPIIFLDHADHIFWLGAGISDVVVNLRESGMFLAQKRRQIQAERNAILPIILEPTQRLLSRVEAKRQLGLPEDSVMLLSIARTLKYKTVDGVSYAEAHISLLNKYKQATLVVVGCGYREDWSGAIEQTQGRIIVHPERDDTAVFYQAADIYVDSFPFVSTTSLLEAGSYGVPLVSRFPYSNASTIFGADMPGLTGNLIRVRNLEEYTKVLSQLIEDEEFRLNLGEATREKIAKTHSGSNWRHSLENIYARATTLDAVKAHSPTDQIFLGEPDVFVPSIHGGNDFDLDDLIRFNLEVMPFTQRLHHWLRLVKKYGFHNNFGRFGQFRLLVPEWLYSRYISISR
ncbi:hypothetical protein RIVM261_011750 [Rivularia sp. IAM M-261]|nr:hypothetical protein RIVM261_011750 [Rivularia sp. IAM M-261]